MGQTARGSIRERRPEVWETRIPPSAHPDANRIVARQMTFQGNRADATTYAADLAADHTTRRSIARAAPFVTVDENPDSVMLEFSGNAYTDCINRHEPGSGDYLQKHRDDIEATGDRPLVDSASTAPVSRARFIFPCLLPSAARA